MRLRDLDAKFLDSVSVTGSHMMDSALSDGAQGILFQCPSCAIGKEVVTDSERYIGQEHRRYVVGAHYIQVLFSNPRGANPAPDDAGVEGSDGSHPRWSIVSGGSLDDLTLSPSINCDIPWTDEQGVEHPSVCKFHGFVKNGEAS